MSLHEIPVPKLLEKKTCHSCNKTKFVFEFYSGRKDCADCSRIKTQMYRRQANGIPVSTTLREQDRRIGKFARSRILQRNKTG